MAAGFPHASPHPHAHPHALPGVAFAPAGMQLPATGVTEAPRPLEGWRASLDVAGGVAFAILVWKLCEWVTAQALAGGAGWSTAIAYETMFVAAAMLCVPLLPGAVRHDISWRSTLDGLRLDWPELLYATWVLGQFTIFAGSLVLAAGPLGMALAVGAAEEMFFRVLLLGWLIGRVSAPIALTISSLVFGVAHIHEASLLGLLSVVPQTAGGFVLGAVYLRTRNPIGPILAHAYWDYPYFMVLGMGVAGGGTAAGMPTVASLLPWLGMTLYGLWLIRHEVPLAGRVAPLEPAPAHRH